jgi:lipid II:glycine glycyltransferase (peptidoglycan interpeptide bridge formation enzyme)
MLEIQVRRGPLSYRQKWFYSAPVVSDALTAVQYRQAKSCNRIPGFVRKPYHTLLIDLSRDEQALWQGLKKQTRYEIGLAKRAGVSFVVEDDPTEFVTVYNACTKHTGLGKLSMSAVTCYAPFVHFLKAMHGDAPLVVQSTIVDRESGRARILHGASLYRTAQTGRERRFFSTATRLLCWEQMLYFRERGIRYLDLGGYAPASDDSKMQGINHFKDSLGGQLIEESDYMSYPVFLYRLIADGFASVSRQRVARGGHLQ